MTLTSFSFFAFLAAALVVFYSAKKIQKYVLLAACLFFYFMVSPGTPLRILGTVAYVWFITWGGAILIDRLSGRARSILCGLCVLALVGVLVVTKYAYNIALEFSKIFSPGSDFSMLKFGSCIGVSYFFLAAIGYLLEVTWQSYKSEKNPVNICLFVIYFPQVISGPVTRFMDMNSQFNERHDFDSDRFYHGVRRMIWGYFQKLAVSEFFAVVVNSVYANYKSFSGLELLIATFCYAVQLYTDFSGCMDIVLGASELFGITLPENFNAPYLSRSIQEFWQRWHITLGTWFKDFLMYPLQKSSFMVSLAGKCKKVFGKKHGKKIPMYLSMFTLWTLIGIWHGGTAFYFMASGMIPCFLLIIGDLTRDLYKKFFTLIKVDMNGAGFAAFERIKTFAGVLLSWCFICSGDVPKAFSVLGRVFTNFLPEVSFSQMIDGFGLNSFKLFVMSAGIVVLVAHDILKYRGYSVSRIIDSRNIFVRIVVLNAELLFLLAFGMAGSSSFIYFQF